MYALLASLPILFCLIVMSFFNWGAIKSLSVSVIIGIVLSLFVWKIPAIDVFQYIIVGLLESTNIVFIIIGAILLLGVLTKYGATNVINNSLNSLTKDARIQALLIGFIFNTFLSGIAAFSTEIIFSSLILIELGFPAFLAAIIALFFNGPVVTFGAIGIPTITTINLTKPLAQQLGLDVEKYATNVSAYSAFLHFIGSFFIAIIVMYLIVKVFGKEKSWKPFLEIIPFTIFTNICVMLPFYLVARYVNPDLPDIVSSIIGFIIVILALKIGFLIPRNSWKLPPKDSWPSSWANSKDTHSIQFIKPKYKSPNFYISWAPYILCSLILIVTRIPQLGLQEIIKKPVININGILGLNKIIFSLNWLYSPGIMPFFLLSIICIILFKFTKNEIKEIIVFTYAKSKIAAIAIILSVILVQIMLKSADNPRGLEGMLMSIANALSHLQSVGTIIAAPLLGTLGTFVSGSNTTSDILFSIVQFNVAQKIGLPHYILVSLQNVAGGIGIILCIKSIAAVASVTGLTNSDEGKLLKYGLAMALFYILILLTVVFITLAII